MTEIGIAKRFAFDDEAMVRVPRTDCSGRKDALVVVEDGDTLRA